MRNIYPKAIARKMVFLLSAVFLPLSFTTSGQSGGDYSLDWSAIDGGGGTSSGGSYKLSGTIGQPDAAYSSGGDYELLGGFWPGGPLCIVDFEHFARFAEYWLYTGIGLPGDIDNDSDVDYADLRKFTDEWLYYCPYNWPLR